MTTTPEQFDYGWFDVFWEVFQDTFDITEDGASAIGLLGQCLAAGILLRDGDWVTGDGGMERITLDTDMNYLLRRIEDAANKADSSLTKTPQ